MFMFNKTQIKKLSDGISYSPSHSSLRFAWLELVEACLVHAQLL